MRLLAVTEPRAEASPPQPLAAIRAGFEAGAVQAVLLGLAGVEKALPGGVLSAEEETRSRRLISASVRSGFIGGRWLVRSVLATVAGVSPHSLEFRAGSHGKLFLVDHESLAASFNLSHSGDLAAVALVRGRRIGIDIEAERPLTDSALLARRILGPSERKRLESLPERARAAALLTAWTRKEAVLKAIGTGISGGLSSIEGLPESIAADSPYFTGCAAEPSTRWCVLTLAMPPGFRGAIAVDGEVPSLVSWQAVPARPA